MWNLTLACQIDQILKILAQNLLEIALCLDTKTELERGICDLSQPLLSEKPWP